MMEGLIQRVAIKSLGELIITGLARAVKFSPSVDVANPRLTGPDLNTPPPVS